MTPPIEENAAELNAHELNAAADAAPARLWPMVREALAGSRRDLTAMPLGRAILLLAIPMVLEMVMESIFALTDIFWVSKLGADAIATVGLTESLLTVIYALAMGLSIGVGAVVARRTGAKDPSGAARAAVQAILIGVVLSRSPWASSARWPARACSASWARRRRCWRSAPATRGSCWAAASPSCCCS